MAMVAAKTGMVSSWALFHAAVQGSMPWSNLSTWSSMITMALSTTMPSTTMRPASDTVCSCTPSAFSTASVIAIVTGMLMAATEATRMGKSNMVTTITETMARPKSRRK